MSKAKNKEPVKAWRGQEVERSPDGQAERAAERAEGNGEVSVADALRASDGAPASGSARGSERRAGTPDDPDEKTAEAAEEHRERLARGARPARHNTL